MAYHAWGGVVRKRDHPIYKYCCRGRGVKGWLYLGDEVKWIKGVGLWKEGIGGWGWE